MLSLPDALVDQFRRHPSAEALERGRAGAAWSDNDLLFAREDGSPIRKETDSAEGIASWLRAAPLHDARHTAATLLLVQGVSAGAAIRLLGHADTRVTARYQHVVEETAKA